MLSIETMVMDARNIGLTSSTSTTLACSQENVHKAIYVKKKIKDYENKIALLENQVEYYKILYVSSFWIHGVWPWSEKWIKFYPKEFYARAQHLQAQGKA